ncbi:MAG: C-3',4' desaturase CrtD [Pseudanabaena sp.]|jgi:C-3',4' desaturase CrtD|nr:C-3',4' desaturase CrtD [Pseudanabaena sp. M090S1SP2A07QC]MCA6505295.1 C-3',4' desaturase CrtD [Pseudanabaena sp. M172S2SP2A07QC]MCA6509813.1 C-3',4' desaturase CrtD [Pseudanabaena sp. M109S1SP2A07QC]MCA6518163.1 C-3',4' desaturase CrtD [Pseudanabaena sp. M110S1SP2A07QC]MCA6521700.1 C-3',4' desaturase CrtD [Pseudanabaena sp. M051S1SP2A07QC]MCA6527870.1 C-3',4' desaturase CrtD [Pseudanabaena sp. M179S2SP2A07QC]MCA6529685.1 C-3',4' desaturase CrtD [Pseudanabaena sp. M125S2SP2A07QC]MCA653273
MKVPQKIIVVGAGIGGLTAAALLAGRGYEVIVYDLALVAGGCASTFKRRGFTFDVGATQVAGLESGGIHDRIFKELEIEIPESTYCDPACAVFLPNESEPINVWRDRHKWKLERQRQFPNSETFWDFLEDLFWCSWRFQSRDPILPPRNIWDIWQLVKALRIDTLATIPYTFSTVGDALRGFGLDSDKRLRTFLDLQLKLYSQVNAEETALLYAATALAVSQAPLGLFHLQGSMQVLSDRLIESIERDGGKILMQHEVTAIADQGKIKKVKVKNLRTGETAWDEADHVVANVTVNNFVRLLGDGAPKGYSNRVANLKPASVAFVVYLGVDRVAIPDNCPPHLQFLEAGDKPHSLFISVSKEGDGRAPEGRATIIASEFTDASVWYGDEDYQELKKRFTERAIAQLSTYFHLNEETIIHIEAATPQTFARYTGRDRGIVGGVGMRVSTFGPFGFANRTPLKNIWLVGDSTHPGEGTAGVSYSAMTVVRQIEQQLERKRFPR